jgi:hypothetical protein
MREHSCKHVFQEAALAALEGWGTDTVINYDT